MDDERRDKLCGGAPTHKLACPVEGCKRKVGPYYSAAIARDAMAEHISVCHNMHMVTGKDDRVHARTRNPEHERVGKQ